VVQYQKMSKTHLGPEHVKAIIFRKLKKVHGLVHLLSGYPRYTLHFFDLRDLVALMPNF
jgi:hypothetical protein